MSINTGEVKPLEDGSDKKAYHSPQLLAYGNIIEITQAVANNSNTTDGGTMATQKTS